jgi:hypothetical protein
MKQFFGIMVVAVLCFATASFAQVGSPVSMPSITTTIGVGGGLSTPSGDLSNHVNSGYHGVAKLTLGAILPFDIDASVSYHHFPYSQGSASWNVVQVTAGIQYSLGIPVVSPYVLASAAYNSASSSGTIPGVSNGVPVDVSVNSSAEPREGVNLGVGAKLFSFDASVQYEMLNLMGKDTGETTSDMIAVSVMYTFGL